MGVTNELLDGQGVGVEEKQSDSSSALTVDSDKQAGALKSYLRIFAHSEPKDWLLNAVAVLAAIGSGVALAVTELLFGNFVNVIQDFRDGNTPADEFRHQIATGALKFVYVFIARFGCTYLFMVCSSITGTRITRNVRYRFLEATLSQDIAYFDNAGRGSVPVLVTTNGNVIQQGISEKLALSVQALATCVAAVIISLIVQWKLTLITISVLPVIVAVVGTTVGMEAKIEGKILEIYSQAAALAEDVISSMKNVHAFWMRPRLVEKYDGYLQEGCRRGLKKSPIWGFMFATEYFLLSCGFALAFWRGVHMYAEGDLAGPGTVITVLFSVTLASTSLNQISPYIASFASAASAAAVLFKTIDRKSVIDPFHESGLQPEEIDGRLEFSNVHFSYPTRLDAKVLDDFSLVCPSNKTTALVGASGSGKSTIIGLLERWYNPGAGSISLDGRPIDQLNLAWLRTRMRLVQQEPVLFNGTVFENVCNGLRDTVAEEASRETLIEHVVAACKMSNSHDFIEDLPEGYDTHVGERASMLSGGQKQRIAIARAIISNPEILLLDEATSALDPHSETAVQKALNQASANRTTIVIAHKLATIRNADNIVILSGGKIVEQGTHEELMQKKEAYFRLVQAQDLESGEGPESPQDSVDEKVEHVGMTKMMSHVSDAVVSTISSPEAREGDKYKTRGMLRIVGSIIREQRVLWPWFVFIFIACVIGGLVYPAQAIIMAQTVDVFKYSGNELIRQGDFYSFLFFIIALVNLIVYFFLGWSTNIVCQRMTLWYRRVMFDSILKQDIHFFDHAENTTGALTSRLSAQPTQLQELMGFNLAIIVIVVANVISSSVVGFAFGWKLSLVVVFGGLPPILLAGFIRMQLEIRMTDDSSGRLAASAALAGEAVEAIRTVSSLALEKRVLKRYREVVDNVVRVSLPSIMHSMFWFALSQSMEFLVLALGFWYGSKLVSTGEYSIRQFFIVFVGIFLSGQAAAQFFMYITSITKAISAGNYINWLRSLQPTMTETEDNKDRGPPAGEQTLEVDGVDFSYPTRKNVLRGVELNVRPGSFVALVGGSGCGKSTMISMFERFYDPSTGTILLGQAEKSTDVSTLNPRLYRRQMSLVQQEPTLYQGTIRENISLGLEDAGAATDERVVDACRQANIHDFVASLPEGLDTLCGSRGISLSGGQRQRIAIARALVRDPKILLLDEATSALDTESERVVQAAIAAAAKAGNRSTVAVAHRLSTVKDADRIFVFLGGRIEEAGTHRELLARRGLYFRMCEAQSLG